MTEIRPARAADALRLAGQLAQLGYPSELDAVTSRLAGVLKSATQQILVAAPPDDSRIDGYISLERRLTLHQDEHVEITDLVIDAAARRSGLGRALITDHGRRTGGAGGHCWTACTPRSWWASAATYLRAAARRAAAP